MNESPEIIKSRNFPAKTPVLCRNQVFSIIKFRKAASVVLRVLPVPALTGGSDPPQSCPPGQRRKRQHDPAVSHRKCSGSHSQSLLHVVRYHRTGDVPLRHDPASSAQYLFRCAGVQGGGMLVRSRSQGGFIVAISVSACRTGRRRATYRLIQPILSPMSRRASRSAKRARSLLDKRRKPTAVSAASEFSSMVILGQSPFRGSWNRRPIASGTFVFRQKGLS